MRRAREVQIVFTDDGTTVTGAWLGADFTAEHEWGIKGLAIDFGVDSGKLGIKGRTVTNTEAVQLLHGAKYDYLVGGDFYRMDAAYLDKHDELHSTYATPKPDRVGAWSDKRFCIGAKDDAGKAALSELYQAFIKKDVALYIGGANRKNPFDRGGLTIAIVSKLEKSIKDDMMSVDKDYKALKQEAAKLKIEEMVRKKSGYGSVSPKWAKDSEHLLRERPTKYKIIYWLNCSKAYGWYTVEEIKEWVAKDTGLIAEDIRNRQQAKASA